MISHYKIMLVLLGIITPVTIFAMNETKTTVLDGHTRPVTSVAVKGEYIFSGSEDGTARLWSTNQHKETLFTLHRTFVNAVAITKDRLITASEDGTVAIGDFHANILKIIDKNNGPVFALATMKIPKKTRKQHQIDDPTIPQTLLIAGYKNHEVKTFDLDTGNPLKIYRKHQGAVKALATAELLFISGAQDGTIIIWDPFNKNFRSLPIWNTEVTALATTKDLIIAGYSDWKVRLWNLKGGFLKEFDGHFEPITSVAIVNDNKIISSSKDRTIKAWDLEGNCLGSFIKGAEGISALAAYGTRIVAGNKNNTVTIIEDKMPYTRALAFAASGHKIKGAQSPANVFDDNVRKIIGRIILHDVFTTKDKKTCPIL